MEFTEEEIREAAKYSHLGEGLINLLIKNILELRKEKQKGLLVDMMKDDEKIGLYQP